MCLAAGVIGATAAGAPASAGSHGSEGKIGEFIYFADAALFVDCMSGETVPVAGEGEFLALQRAYLEARAAPEAALVVVVDGRIEEREGMEGGARPTLIVDRVAGVVPGQRCDRASVDSSFDDTYWKLLTIGGEPIAIPLGTREAHIQFGIEGNRFSSTAGCNMINGLVEGEVPDITIGTGAMTMMACPPPLDTQEFAFVEALNATSSVRVIGPTLELLDGDGNGLAFFEAIAMP